MSTAPHPTSLRSATFPPGEGKGPLYSEVKTQGRVVWVCNWRQWLRSTVGAGYILPSAVRRPGTGLVLCWLTPEGRIYPAPTESALPYSTTSDLAWGYGVKQKCNLYKRTSPAMPVHLYRLHFYFCSYPPATQVSSMARKSSSLRMGMPSSRALRSLEPAFSPTTT